jgi:hypothetical protein
MGGGGRTFPLSVAMATASPGLRIPSTTAAVKGASP